MGGDEFIILLTDLVDPPYAEQVAAKIVAALVDPHPYRKTHLPISVSIGVCTLSDEVVEAEVLLQRVDAAMYRAKQRGRSCFQVSPAICSPQPRHDPGRPNTTGVPNLRLLAGVGPSPSAHQPDPPPTFVSPSRFLSIARAR